MNILPFQDTITRSKCQYFIPHFLICSFLTTTDRKSCPHQHRHTSCNFVVKIPRHHQHTPPLHQSRALLLRLIRLCGWNSTAFNEAKHPGLRDSYPGLRDSHPGLRGSHPGLYERNPGEHNTAPGNDLNEPATQSSRELRAEIKYQRKKIRDKR
jgi:hypothetical protein